MGWKIIFAPQALEELEQIVRFIAHDDPQAAIRFGDLLSCHRTEQKIEIMDYWHPARREPKI
jgi:hypothetical protein